jgi:hypothetical protein
MRFRDSPASRADAPRPYGIAKIAKIGWSARSAQRGELGLRARGETGRDEFLENVRIDRFGEMPIETGGERGLLVTLLSPSRQCDQDRPGPPLTASGASRDFIAIGRHGV